MTTATIFRRLAPLAVLLAAATSCTHDQRRSLGEEDVRDSLRATVERVLDDHGTELEGSLDCTSTISTDGAVTGSCTGTTSDGRPVAGAYTGTADVDAESCTADSTVAVADQQLANGAGVDCFKS
jgi:hypothetical protein